MTNKEKTKIQKMIVTSLPLNPRGRLLLAPRIGKTKITIDVIKKNKPKSILWVTPSAKLANEDIPKEFDTWNAKKYLKVLTTVTWKSLDKIKGHFDMIILDEEQFATVNNVANLLNGTLNSTSLISMTGTQSKTFIKNEIYKALRLPMLYEMTINEAVDIGLLANYIIKVVYVSMGFEKNIKAGSKDKPFLTSESAQYKWLDKVAEQAIEEGDKMTKFKVLARMRAVHNSPSKLLLAKAMNQGLKGRKMFFCASIKQAESISEHVFHSKSKKIDIQRFIDGEINEIAMVNSGGTGWTYKEIDHLIMVQADSDKNGATSQKIARTLLQQKNYKATIWILCLKGTQDLIWLDSALDSFDREKVEFYEYEKLTNSIKRI